MIDKKQARLRRARKTRAKIAELNAVRLSVHRTNCHIYAQVISSCGSKVLAAASTLFLTPVAYLMLAGLAKPRGHIERLLSGELSDAEKLGLIEDEMVGPKKPSLAAE